MITFKQYTLLKESLITMAQGKFIPAKDLLLNNTLTEQYATPIEYASEIF